MVKNAKMVGVPKWLTEKPNDKFDKLIKENSYNFIYRCAKRDKIDLQSKAAWLSAEDKLEEFIGSVVAEKTQKKTSGKGSSGSKQKTDYWFRKKRSRRTRS